MGAYNPRSDLLNPQIAPGTKGYGAGLAALGEGIGNAWKQGTLTKHADVQQQKGWEHQDAAQQRGYDFSERMQKAGWDRADDRQKAAYKHEDDQLSATKSERAENIGGAWEAMQQMAPGLISPEMNEKFQSSGLGAKEGMFNAASVHYKKWAADQEGTGGELVAKPIKDESGKVYGTQFVTPKGKPYGYQPAPQEAPTPPPGMDLKSWSPKSGGVYGPPSSPAPTKPKGPPKVQKIGEQDVIWDEANGVFVPVTVGGAPAGGPKRKDSVNW